MHLIIKNFSVHLFCIAVLSTFLTLKVYPIFYLAFVFYTFLFGKFTNKNNNLIVLSIFLFVYTTVIFIINFSNTDLVKTTYIKFLFNILFFISVLLSADLFNNFNKDDNYILKVFEKYLSLAIILSLLQVIFVQIYNGGIRFSAESSYDAGLMFEETKIFWGVQDKNMIGAKIALFGFLHAYIYYRLYGKINFLYGFLYLICTALTLSRTSVLLAVISFGILYIYSVKGYYRVFLIFPIFILGLTVFISKILDFIRIDSILESSPDDGMGIRILYWLSFYNNFDKISLWGNGVLSAIEFLNLYSPSASNNMHNLFLNTYLDLGLFGLVMYLFLLISIFLKIYNASYDKKVAILLLIPIFIVINTLYTSYDNDPWLYFLFVIIISNAYINSNLHHKR